MKNWLLTLKNYDKGHAAPMQILGSSVFLVTVLPETFSASSFYQYAT